jgi:hypothetical protein
MLEVMMWPLFNVLIFIVILSACTNDEPIVVKDVGIDQTSESDMKSDDITDAYIPTVDQTRCPRGTYWDGGECNSLAGCSWFVLTRETRGCAYLPQTQGRMSDAQCVSDEDCRESNFGPYCITRVCHNTPPCSSDVDCAEGLECIQGETCMEPPHACETREDCPDPATCVDGLCY